MGGLTQSRGPTKGGKVYTSVDELPDERGELAIIWVKPKTSPAAVELAHQAGCTQVWFSFKTGHRDAVAKAKELGMQVVEVGRCPVYYLDGAPWGCALHAAGTKLSGTWAREPNVEADNGLREMI